MPVIQCTNIRELPAAIVRAIEFVLWRLARGDRGRFEIVLDGRGGLGPIHWYSAENDACQPEKLGASQQDRERRAPVARR